jgi:hypothetical protein
MVFCVKRILVFIQVLTSITLTLSMNNYTEESTSIRKIIESSFQPSEKKK